MGLNSYGLGHGPVCPSIVCALTGGLIHWRIQGTVFSWWQILAVGIYLPPFWTFSTDLGHFILELLNFDIFLFLYLFSLLGNKTSSQSFWGWAMATWLLWRSSVATFWRGQLRHARISENNDDNCICIVFHFRRHIHYKQRLFCASSQTSYIKTWMKGHIRNTCPLIKPATSHTHSISVGALLLP